MEMENVPGSAWVISGGYIPPHERESMKSFLGTVAKGAAEYVDAEKSTLFLVGKDESELVVINAETVETKELKTEEAVEMAVKVGSNGTWKRLICDADYNALYELRVLLKNKEGKIIGIISVIKKNGKFMKYDKCLLESYANRVAIPILENIINHNESVTSTRGSNNAVQTTEVRS